MSHMLNNSGCFSSLNMNLTLYLVFYKRYSVFLICSFLFISIFFFYNVFCHWSRCSCPHLCACVTVVVRSQVVVLVLRGSVVEETQCPYQEAGWTGNPAGATNVINWTYCLDSTVQVQNIPKQQVNKMQRVEGTTNLFWVKRARKSDGCLIRA